MSRKSYFVFKGMVVLAFAVAGVQMGYAQMTIFNIPSTDTLAKSSVYVEADLITKPVKYSKGGYQTYGYRVVYGLGHYTEIGANFFYTRDGSGSAAEVQFNAKQTIYRNEKHGIGATVGALFSMPLRDRRGAKRYGMLYANASKTIEHLNGLRLTGGAYTIVGIDKKDFGTKTGAMFGIEQPIYKRWSFIGDWYSGNNRLGYASAGINFAISKRSYILGGYSFGNYGRGNNALVIFYGYTF